MIMCQLPQDLDGKVEYWMNRYDSDLEAKINEVQDIKVSQCSVDIIS